MSSRETILDAYRNGTFVQLVADDVAVDDEAAVRLCVELHNGGELNLLALADDPVLRGISGHSFFVVQYFFNRTIPSLNGTVTEMMRLVRLLVERGGNDLAANEPNAAFKKWCESDPERARSVIKLADSGDELATQHLSFALVAGRFLQTTCELAAARSGEIQLAAIAAISRIVPLASEETDLALTALSTAVENSPGIDAVLGATLWATLEVVEHSSPLSTERWLPLLRACLFAEGAQVQFLSARALWSHLRILSPEAIQLLLSKLKHVDPSHKGTIDELDLGLAKLAESPNGEIVPTFVLNWLKTNTDIDSGALDAASRALLDRSKTLWGPIIVEWLLDGDPQCCQALGSWINTVLGGDAALDLPADAVPDDDNVQYLLCRRSIGYFFVHPVTAASLLLSIARKGGVKIRKEIAHLLFEPMLINYGGLRQYLESVPTNDLAKSVSVQALAAADKYLADLKHVPPIPELHGSEHDTQIEQVRWHEEMRRAMKLGRESSILFNLVHRSTILYGRSSLTRVTDSEGNTKRVPMELNQFSTSFELPRQEVLDPAGIDYELRALRVGRLRE